VAEPPAPEGAKCLPRILALFDALDACDACEGLPRPEQQARGLVNLFLRALGHRARRADRRARERELIAAADSSTVG
jgi:hypothetical protein